MSTLRRDQCASTRRARAHARTKAFPEKLSGKAFPESSHDACARPFPETGAFLSCRAKAPNGTPKPERCSLTYASRHNVFAVSAALLLPLFVVSSPPFFC
eukprot:195447-Pleurochrysis_carterae.AAC.1